MIKVTAFSHRDEGFFFSLEKMTESLINAVNSVAHGEDNLGMIISLFS